MKRTLLVLALPVLLFACNSHRGQHDNEELHEHATIHDAENARDGIFIHLSKGPDNPHRVLMAFKMADVMSNDKDVIMYLDIDAVHLLVQGAPNVSMEGFPSSHEQIAKLTQAGVIIQACPTCLKVAGYSEEDLMEGVILANKEKFFNFTQGKILTIDY